MGYPARLEAFAQGIDHRQLTSVSSVRGLTVSIVNP